MFSINRPFRGHSRGQAITEFALIIVALLMLMFFIIDAGRIGWAWVTVQGAARAGARYASTGNGGCRTPPDRLECVKETTFDYMDTLPLHEDPEAPWATNTAYRIEVWGVDANNQGPWFDNPGAPGKPVVVRAYYWVPIVTPFFRPIRENIPVFGQVTITNELFDSLGGASAGVGLPPPMPPLPPAQPTPTFTPTPTPSLTPTASPTITPTLTPVPSQTLIPTRCDTHFDKPLVLDETFAAVSGNLDSPPSGVTLYDLSETATPGAPRLIGTGSLNGPIAGHDCLGFDVSSVSPPLQVDHVILVSNDTDASWDTEIVLPGTPTPTPMPTPSQTPTSSPTPTATPTGPYIRLDPICGFGTQVRMAVEGYNWTDSASPINLFWIEDGASPQLETIIPAGHPADFVRFWQFANVSTGVHTVEARSGSTVQTATFEVPCANPTDLIISDPVITNPPTEEQDPFEVMVAITNTGSIDASQQFFVDVFLDPSVVYTNTIPLEESDGYLAVNGLGSGASKTLTITVPFGFSGGASDPREVWSMVDTLEQHDELHESNNIGGPTYLSGLPSSPPYTPTPAPAGSELVSGIVRAVFGGPASPQIRAQVWLVNDSSVVVSTTFSDRDAYYQFNNIEAGTYSVWACVPLDNKVFVGSRTGIVPTDPLVDIFMVEDVAGCPYYPVP